MQEYVVNPPVGNAPCFVGRTGNTISFSNKKTRRKFKPNVQRKSVYSEILDKWIRFHMTTTALRGIDRAGGIDKYLMGMSDKKLNSVEGSRAKREIETERARQLALGYTNPEDVPREKEVFPAGVIPPGRRAGKQATKAGPRALSYGVGHVR